MKKNSGPEVSLLWFLALHLSLVVNSIQGVFSKQAGKEKAMSLKWIFLFGMMFVTMLVFALAWQQVLKHMSLTFAFTNKPVTIIWGLIWGVLIFREHVTPNMIIGSVVILIGIMVGVSGSGGRKEDGAAPKTGKGEEA